MRVSPSQIRTWKDCPQEWHYSYVDGLRLKKSSRHFDIGTYTHELFHVLYQFYQAMPHIRPGSDEAISMMRHRIDSDMADFDIDNIDVMSVVWPLVSKYVQYQSPRIDKGIQILGVEHEFRQELEDGLIIHGFIDLIYRDRAGNIRVRDHKTSANAASWTQDKLKMDEQLLMYALGVAMEFGKPVYDVEINFANTSQSKKPKPTAELFQLYRHQHNEHSIEAFKNNLVILHKKMSDPPHRNYSGRCAGCRFHTLCYLETRGQDTTATINAMYQQIERDLDNG
jgi:hypothetical protein